MTAKNRFIDILEEEFEYEHTCTKMKWSDYADTYVCADCGKLMTREYVESRIESRNRKLPQYWFGL